MKRCRRTFTAAVLATTANDLVLEVRSGAWERRSDKAGDVVEDKREDSARWRADIGDRAVVAHSDPNVDELAGVEVVDVLGPQRIRAVILCGGIGTAQTVYVLPARKAKAARPKVRESTLGQPSPREKLLERIREGRKLLEGGLVR